MPKLRPAPLLATADIRPPPGGEAWFADTPHGSMRIVIWRNASQRQRGTVLLCHGLGECIEKHCETAADLLARDFSAVFIDQAGHGLSSNPDPAAIMDFSCYDSCIDTALAVMEQLELEQPWLGMGHSMGGCVMLSCAKRNSEAFAGIFLIAPMMGVLIFEQFPVLEATSRLLTASPYSPFMNFPEFIPKNYTSDRFRLTRCRALLLSHPRLRARVPAVPWGHGAFARIAQLHEPGYCESIKLPTAIAAGGKEVLVSNAAMRDISELLPNCRLLMLDEGQHELLQENDSIRAQLWEHIDTFFAHAADPQTDPT